MTDRPITDLDDLVSAATDQAVDTRILPAVERLERATKTLEEINPLLEAVVRRQNAHLVWLYVLSASVVFIGLILWSHLSR